MTSQLFSEIGKNRSKIGTKLEQNRSKFGAKKKKTSAEIVSPPSIFIKMAQFFFLCDLWDTYHKVTSGFWGICFFSHFMAS